ncbi:MAG: hypothetical protein MJ092_08510 [Lachnospiraceae bacterium]|nr:hypothetical protein [Lachnospiraceae bacterium]
MTRIVVGIMIAFFVSIIVCFVAIKLGADNLFQMDHDIETKVYEITEDDSYFDRIYKGYSNGIYAGKNYVDAYSNDLLLGRTTFVENAVRYKNLIGWKIYAPGEYNSILYLDHGYLASANGKESKEDIQKIATKIEGLRAMTESSGADFLYIQTPGNLDKYGDKGLNKVKDFANYNTDLLVSDLRSSGINCYDIRETVYEERKDFHSLFYKTDHHWKQETALWATKKIVAYLNDNYGLEFDLSKYEPENYREEVFKDYYLGSLGKRATLAAVEPDDFILLYPKFETDITFKNAKGIDVRGTFDVTYNREQIDAENIYKRECYLGLLSFEGTGLSSVENNLAENEIYILIVGDSMMIPVTSFLALDCKKVELIDPRYFEGSIKEYIQEQKPDLVINTYSTTIIQDYYPIFDFE